jgi:predicted DNA-binding transcriptional regulator YafY
MMALVRREIMLEDRGLRLLWLYETLSKGIPLKKAALAKQFGISAKTVQRDIEDLRAYLAEKRLTDTFAEIRYDRARNEYRLVRPDRERLTSEEVLALCKILLESRAFPKDELEPMLDKLLLQIEPEGRKSIQDRIKNERFCYVPLRHGKRLLSLLWVLSRSIRQCEVTEFTYTRQDGNRGKRKVKPVALMFSEFYFYLIAWLAEGEYDFPAVFRVDRIEDIRETEEKFFVPYAERFSGGEFRKRVQFMYPGKLQKVTFRFKGGSIEAVLDRLPTAEAAEEPDGGYTVTAEVYGKGIDMWLRSQGDFVSGVKFSSAGRKEL